MQRTSPETTHRTKMSRYNIMYSSVFFPTVPPKRVQKLVLCRWGLSLPGGSTHLWRSWVCQGQTVSCLTVWRWKTHQWHALHALWPATIREWSLINKLIISSESWFKSRSCLGLILSCSKSALTHSQFILSYSTISTLIFLILMFRPPSTTSCTSTLAYCYTCQTPSFDTVRPASQRPDSTSPVRTTPTL